ncbi:pseudouridylate synthase [Cryobacterium sp. TMT2-10]|uniref:pseudouridine synthase n=2 Tax=Cryobacterium TaxID=69578 RepID=UPI0010690078|nr:pseudouridine synthase [Cryobacterium sp. TMT2-23]TFC88443.1 pseudouridylate synthase [Cryobacterium sp. TmT2-59]TFD18918.1 pseudouridylate synthase [Cryobacterium sp. TMT2-23]TFD35775.1 pseudouridylate synthase [Cryobacterium sp. TMT2-10]
MPPPSPLPQRHGLDAAWVSTPDRDRARPHPWPTMGAWLLERLAEFVDVAAFLAGERFAYQSGEPVVGSDPYQPHTFVWFHRDLADEAFVPGIIHVVHRDARLVVIDKPAFLSTIPRGRHVLQSVVVRLRAELGLPELSPLHRLDRVTSGLLVLATERRWRGAYQTMFQRGEVGKTYRALAPLRPELDLPVTVRNHLATRRGHWQAEVTDDPANAESLIELETVLQGGVQDGVQDIGVYRLTPRTGRTHQLRMHMLGLGIPIIDDPVYPVVQDVAIDDFTRPLQLLASEVTFTDPIDGELRRFESVRTLPLPAEAARAE